MSNNSRSDSSSSQKSKFAGFRLGRTQSSGEASATLKKEISRITDSMRSAGKNIGSSLQSVVKNVSSPKSETNVYSRGIPELDQHGYQKYNLEEDVEIFISMTPDQAFFNEGEQVTVRATEGNTVGHRSAPRAEVAVDTMDVPAQKSKGDIFKHAKYGNVEEKFDRSAPNSNVSVQDYSSMFDKMGAGNAAPKVSVKYEEPVVEEPIAMEAPQVVEDAPEMVMDTIEEVPEAVVDVMEEVSEDVEATNEIVEMIDDPDSDTVITILNPDNVVDVEPMTVTAELPEITADVIEESFIDETPVFEESVVEQEIIEEVPETVAVESKHDDFFIDADDVELSDSGDVESGSDDDWKFIEMDDESEESVVMDVDETIEVTAELPETVVDVSEEVPAEATVEIEAEPEIVEVPVEEQKVSDVIANALNEQPAEAPIVATAGLQKSTGLEGLYVEANEKTSDAVAIGETIVTSKTEMAETSSVCETPKAVPLHFEDESKFNGMKDPVVHRPTRSYRVMKFTNGKLENVAKKEEPNEGLRGPFDRTVGQTVVRSGPIERIGAGRPSRPRLTIDDEVADIMKLTVPELVMDEDSSTVEFGEMFFPDDGLEEICFTYKVPVMEIPVPEFPAIAAAQSVVAIPAAKTVPTICAAQEPALIPAAPEVRIVEEVVAEEKTEAPVIEQIETDHAVVFSFGGSGSDGSVCFSF